MTDWVVELNADSDTAKRWMKLFPNTSDMPAVITWKHNEIERVVLSAKEIGEASKPVEAHAVASAIISLMNSIATVRGAAAVTAGIVYDRANPNYKGMITASISLTMPSLFVSAVIYTHGAAPSERSPSPTSAQMQYKAAERNNHYRDALRYLSESDDWQSLYKVQEALAKIRSEDSWRCISKSEWNRLKRTANEPRHHENKVRTPQPMLHHQAVDYVVKMLDEAASVVAAVEVSSL
ncbi:hypothetical protein CO671_29840 [Rhizobium sp. M10]|uniref:hypothetical protein n=1 Tax=Rhizobium sp. M10 TaxID=1324586 RepID=UPI000BEA7F09|nr:hypothetical protein [Rhizobium sp. M10]PDT32229.1 hypothetical protein CO671_29840 [Rhizobium sp. M10]